MGEHTGLFQALLAFQRDVPTLGKDGDNPHFGSKYTPLDTIVQTIQPHLTEHDLVWTAYPTSMADGSPALGYSLLHAPSGEELNDEMPLMLDKRNSQGLGSALTYARRYALTSVLNLVADEDDDGNKASTSPPPAQTQHKDDARPAAPRIPVDRAQSILQQAVRTLVANGDGATMASLDLNAAPGTPPEFHPVFKARLGLEGVARIGELNVDAAESVEAFLTAEREGQG